MGNNSSQMDKSQKSLEHVVNYIASRYILTQNFKDMQNLSDLKYCDNLVILTSKIIKEYLPDSSIEYLAQKKGVMGEKLVSESVIAIDKNLLSKLDVTNTTKKRRLCIGIANHYVQVANIFSAITTTLNPVYNYKDSSGNVTQTSLSDKTEIPKDSQTKITRNNLCSNRLNALLNNQNYENVDTRAELKINPKFCSFNTKGKNLDQEPGIPELKHLYVDKYDYDTGEFKGMTQKMKDIYQQDVETLYKAFSGNTSVPKDKVTGKPTITEFSDIPLKDFYNSEGCVKGTYNMPVTGSLKSILFQEYARNIKEMMAEIKKYHGQLLDILDKLFVFGINPDTNDKQVLVNPDLDDKLLANLTIQTQDVIVQLYTSCEHYFIEGLKIYEAIAKKQLLDTTKSQIDSLNDDLDKQLPIDISNQTQIAQQADVSGQELSAQPLSAPTTPLSARTTPLSDAASAAALSPPLSDAASAASPLPPPQPQPQPLQPLTPRSTPPQPQPQPQLQPQLNPLPSGGYKRYSPKTKKRSNRKSKKTRL